MLFRIWAVQYISVSQRPYYTSKMQARIRAIFAKGTPGPYTFWGATDGLFFLHISLFLFVIGAVIYLFNINRCVFYAVIWWVGYMAISYASTTVKVFFEPHQLFHTPLSSLALRIYLCISYVVFQICSHISALHTLHDNARRHYHRLSNRYRNGVLVGKGREAEEIASKPSSEIDSRILTRILPTLDDDHSLETFFDAIPGFCSSKSCGLPFSNWLQTDLRQALDRFLNSTFSSSLISESVRTGRFITCLDAAQAALGPDAVSRILDNIFNGHWDEALQSAEIGHALRLWRHSRYYDRNVRRIVACITARVQGRDDRWTMLVQETFGVPNRALRDYLAHGDSALLSLLIHVSRQANRDGSWTSGILSSLSKFDICNTLPKLQHDFCTLWNEITQEAKNQGPFSTPSKILRDIRHLYIALHHGTDVNHTPFSIFADSFDLILDQTLSYPLCDLAGHRPDFTPHVLAAQLGTDPPSTQPDRLSNDSPYHFTFDFSNSLRLSEETNNITGFSPPPDPSTIRETREASEPQTATFLIRSDPPSSYWTPQDRVAMVQPDITPAAKLSHPLKGNEYQGLATPYAIPLAGISEILPQATVPTPVPALGSTPSVLGKPSATYDADPTFISKSSHPAFSGCFSAPDSTPPPPVPLMLNAELFSLRHGTSPKGPPDNTKLPRLHPRRNMCLADAMSQLLVYCPPFRDLLKDVGRLVGQREGGESGCNATPLLHALVGCLDEFAYYEEKPPMTRQVLQQDGVNKVRADEYREKEDGGVHLNLSTGVYDTMEEERQFIIMRVRFCAHVIAF